MEAEAEEAIGVAKRSWGENGQWREGDADLREDKCCNLGDEDKSERNLGPGDERAVEEFYSQL
jgi:hypothetical protein